jgi:hypothetical protein
MCGVPHGQVTTKTLRLIGYWAESGQDQWPDPAVFVSPSPDTASRQRVLDYLRSGTVYVVAGGPSFCRLCGTPNGSTELTDGERFVWPEGLAHYVSEHDVRLPGAVTVLMVQPPGPVDVETFEDGLFRTGQITIDKDWWRSVGNLH